MPHSLRAKLSGLHYKGILEDKDYKRLCHALDLEKAEQKQKSGKWINVNDMLPREREDVLVTCFVHENWQTKIGYWNGKAWVVNAYDILFIDRLEVIAWMPLPKPYEPQESEE